MGRSSSGILALTALACVRAAPPAGAPGDAPGLCSAPAIETRARSEDFLRGIAHGCFASDHDDEIRLRLAEVRVLQVFCAAALPDDGPPDDAEATSRLDGAERAYLGALAVPETSVAAEAHYGLAMLRLNLGRRDEAIADLIAAMEAPGEAYPRAHARLALAEVQGLESACVAYSSGTEASDPLLRAWSSWAALTICAERPPEPTDLHVPLAELLPTATPTVDARDVGSFLWDRRATGTLQAAQAMLRRADRREWEPTIALFDPESGR